MIEPHNLAFVPRKYESLGTRHTGKCISFYLHCSFRKDSCTSVPQLSTHRISFIPKPTPQLTLQNYWTISTDGSPLVAQVYLHYAFRGILSTSQTNLTSVISSIIICRVDNEMFLGAKFRQTINICQS